MTVTKWSVPASAVVAELTSLGITHYVTMPDYVQISVNHRIAEGGLPGVRVVNCATEDEAVAMALGLHVAGAVPYLSMQNQGLFASANALLSVGVNARTPIPIMAGQWGRELGNLGEDPSLSDRLVVRRSEPLLDSLEIPHFRLEGPDDLPVIAEAFAIAHERETPSVVLVGAHTRWT